MRFGMEKVVILLDEAISDLTRALQSKPNPISTIQDELSYCFQVGFNHTGFVGFESTHRRPFVLVQIIFFAILE